MKAKENIRYDRAITAAVRSMHMHARTAGPVAYAPTDGKEAVDAVAAGRSRLTCCASGLGMRNVGLLAARTVSVDIVAAALSTYNFDDESLPRTA